MAGARAKQPTFGFLGEWLRRWKPRRLEGMVRVFAQGPVQIESAAADLQCLCRRYMWCPRCEEAGCDTLPSFGFQGERPRRCKAHMLGGMVPVKSKCEADGCAKHPSFGFLGERPRRCKAHLLEGMMRTSAQGHRSLKVHPLTCSTHVLGRLSESRV